MAEAGTAGAERIEQSGRLSAATTTTGGVRVVTLSGEIDYETGALLLQVLDVRAGASSRVVADMERITFMDSSGINVLISAHNALTEDGGWLRLASPVGPVLRTLRLVGVDTVIDCRESLRHALDA